MKKFAPDTRNFGGRKVISDQFKNHYENLAKIRPTLNTRSRILSHRNNYFNSGDYGFHQTKANKSLLSEHLINLKHMKRRIKSIGSVFFI